MANSMRRWNPWREIARHREVLLVVAPIPRPGVYFPDDSAIVVDAGLSRAMRRSVAAEELAHHALHHRPHHDPLESARLEVRARRWAASRLIDLPALAGALAGASSWSEVADLLDVDEARVRLRVAELRPEERRELRRSVGRRELDL